MTDPRLVLAIALVGLVGCVHDRERDDASTPVGVHGADFVEIHAAELRDRGYDFALCSSCHSDDPDAMDFAGGAADRPCTGCHEDGPTACDTCHDESTGAHPTHLLGGELDKTVACETCHDVPDRWDAPGHLDTDFPAEVTLAGYTPSTGTCSGVACHGEASPTWTAVGVGEAACGTCHGIPPANHVSDQCTTCHGGLDPAYHVDGAVDLGDRSGGCSACHGDATTPAPDSGAHRGHLARSGLRGAVACDDCHVVPDEIADAGHLDADLIAEATGFDRDTRTCGVYCHGAAAPRWDAVGEGEAACGTCHDIPPANAFHDPGLTLGDCHTCHPSVDEFGNIVFTGDVSEHLDGIVTF